MVQAYRWVIDRYGGELIVVDRSGRELGRTTAMLRPMTGKDWQKSAGALGSYRTDRFLCLAMPERWLERAEVGARLIWGGQHYELLQVQPIFYGRIRTHLWIALRAVEVSS